MEINQVKRGQVVDINSKLLVVLETRQKSQARGPSHYKLELKDLKTGAKVFERINAGNTVEAVELESKTFQFLYADDELLHLLDQETFEEFSVEISLIKGTLHRITGSCFRIKGSSSSHSRCSNHGGNA